MKELDRSLVAHVELDIRSFFIRNKIMSATDLDRKFCKDLAVASIRSFLEFQSKAFEMKDYPGED